MGEQKRKEAARGTIELDVHDCAAAIIGSMTGRPKPEDMPTMAYLAPFDKHLVIVAIRASEAAVLYVAKKMNIAGLGLTQTNDAGEVVQETAPPPPGPDDPIN